MTTSAPARAHASSARTPSRLKRPSAPVSSEASGPSRVPSRSTYRQRIAGATVAAPPPRTAPRPAAILRSTGGRRQRNRALGGAARERARGRAPGPRRSLRLAAGADRRDPGRSSTGRSSQALERAGIERLYEHQAEALERAFDGPTIVTTGTASGKSLCFQLPTLEVLTADPDRARAVPLPDQGAGPGPGPGAAPLRARQGDPPGDLRRRHAARRARRDPQAQQPDPHQPRHAPRRDPAPPRRVGRPVREPGVRGRRRGPRLPRRVRLPRRQRAAAPAAGRGDPRHRAAVPARQRDDRQPGRAGRAR